MKKLTALLLVAILVIAMFVIPYADEPAVTEETMGLYRACFEVGNPDVKFLTVEEMRSVHGDVAAAQYAGVISHFYDTGDSNDLSAGRFLLKDFYWEDLLKNEVTPLASDGAKYENYVPGSASSEVTVTEQPFPDVPVDAWYAEAVSAMKDSGIIKGCDDGLFHPERTVTKGEFYALLLRAGSHDGDNIGGGNKGNHWASGILITAAGNYLWPCKVGHEDDLIDRAEAASRVALLHQRATRNKSFAATWKWAQLKGLVGTNEVSIDDIPDHAAIQQYEKNSEYYGDEVKGIVYAYNNGIINGTDDAGTFNPYGTLTRAEAAQMFYNARMTTRLGFLPTKLSGVDGLIFDMSSQENFMP